MIGAYKPMPVPVPVPAKVASKYEQAFDELLTCFYSSDRDDGIRFCFTEDAAINDMLSEETLALILKEIGS